MTSNYPNYVLLDIKTWIESGDFPGIDTTYEFIFDNNFFKSNVKIDNNNYFVTMSIDLSKLSIKGPITFNAFRIETKGIRQNYILQALFPTLTDSFHVRNKFVELI